MFVGIKSSDRLLLVTFTPGTDVREVQHECEEMSLLGFGPQLAVHERYINGIYAVKVEWCVRA